MYIIVDNQPETTKLVWLTVCILLSLRLLGKVGGGCVSCCIYETVPNNLHRCLKMAEKLRMIIDCDPGVDDAVAIMMALSQPSVDLQAVTCVAGNTSIDNVLRNALSVLRACDRIDVRS